MLKRMLHDNNCAGGSKPPEFTMTFYCGKPRISYGKFMEGQAWIVLLVVKKNNNW